MKTPPTEYGLDDELPEDIANDGDEEVPADVVEDPDADE